MYTERELKAMSKPQLKAILEETDSDQIGTVSVLIARIMVEQGADPDGVLRDNEPIINEDHGPASMEDLGRELRLSAATMEVLEQKGFLSKEDVKMLSPEQIVGLGLQSYRDTCHLQRFVKPPPPQVQLRVSIPEPRDDRMDHASNHHKAQDFASLAGESDSESSIGSSKV